MNGFHTGDRDDLEPRIAEILARKMRVRQGAGPYLPRTNAQVCEQLARLFAARGLRDIAIDGLTRMTGGASKEQFAFALSHAGAEHPEKLVLRMDPTMGVVETCRAREAQILAALAGVLPVPPVRYVDRDGVHLGQPGLVTSFVSGVTKPTTMSRQTVSGVGIDYGALTPVIAAQFVANLASLHAFDWRGALLPDFAAPAPGTRQAALRQVNWWARVWEQDLVEPQPVITFAERWLRENAPVCDAPVLVHGDYRAGNFMFAEPAGEFTAVLDWELAHLGDFHDDLAWSAQKLFGSRVGDEILVSGLMTRAEFLAAYEAASGRRIDPRVFHYYEVLNAWKCAVLDLSTSCHAAAAGLSHQDLVLAWVAITGAVFMDQIVKLIEEAR
ncbi:MAG: phosphotransferase family protein [Gammaproteobacteria bacterium]|nr:phosphotransferase family protein [Gammaproteobacteria bacterium]